jgi:hypothetical protein
MSSLHLAHVLPVNIKKEIPTVFKNGGKCPQRGAKDPYFSQIDAEEYLFYNSK